LRQPVIGRAETEAALALRRDGEPGGREIADTRLQGLQETAHGAVLAEAGLHAQPLREGLDEIVLESGAIAVGTDVVGGGGVASEHDEIARFLDLAECAYTRLAAVVA